jgi:hypothetical protein
VSLVLLHGVLPHGGRERHVVRLESVQRFEPQCAGEVSHHLSSEPAPVIVGEGNVDLELAKSVPTFPTQVLLDG